MRFEEERLQAETLALFESEGRALRSDDACLQRLAAAALDDLQAGTLRVFADEDVSGIHDEALLAGLAPMEIELRPLATAVSAAFEADAIPKPGDRAVIARLADSAVASVAPAPERAPARVTRSGRHALWLSPLALVLLLGSAATASTAVVTRARWLPVVRTLIEEVRGAPGPRKTRVRSAPPRTTPRAPMAFAPEIVALPDPVPEPTLVPPEAPSETPMSNRAARSPRRNGEREAALLFDQANQLRRKGRGVEAIQRYRQLQKRFPASAEAQLSFLSLADLLLREKQPQEALRQLNAYLTSAPAGHLREEALYRKAKTLRQVDRLEAAEQTWRELLRVYPESIYKEEAERQLASPSRESP